MKNYIDSVLNATQLGVIVYFEQGCNDAKGKGAESDLL